METGDPAVLTGSIDHRGTVGLMESPEEMVNPGAWVVAVAGTALAVPVYLRALLDRSTEFRGALMRWLHCFALDAHRLVVTNVRDSTLVRSARLVADLDLAHGGCEFKIGQGEIARLLGCQRTTICSAMQHLKTLGLISNARGRVKVKDRAGLHRMVGFDRA